MRLAPVDGSWGATDERSLTLDAQGFVRAVNAADGFPVIPTGGAAPVAATARETTITRLACIKASAEFCAARPDLRSADLPTRPDARSSGL